MRHPITTLVIAIAAGFGAPALAQSTSGASQQASPSTQQQRNQGTQQQGDKAMQQQGGQAGAQGSAQQGAERTIPHPVSMSQTVTLNGTVQSIDRDKRRVSIKGDDGKTAVLRLGQNVANLEKLKQGDRVTARFTEAFAVAIAEGGEEVRPRIEQQVATNRTRGEQRGMGTVEQTVMIAEVQSVDRQNSRVTLRGPDGQNMTINVQDQQALKGIDKGDKVVTSVVEAAALSIDPAGGGAGQGQASGGASSGSGSAASGASPSGAGTAGETSGNTQGTRQPGMQGGGTGGSAGTKQQ